MDSEMSKVTENIDGERFTSLKIAAGLALLIWGAQSRMAIAQNAPVASQKLTLTTAVDLALKQNLDLQIANIETATRQQDRAIARSELLPRANLEADDSVIATTLEPCLAHRSPS